MDGMDTKRRLKHRPILAPVNQDTVRTSRKMIQVALVDNALAEGIKSQHT